MNHKGIVISIILIIGLIVFFLFLSRTKEKPRPKTSPNPSPKVTGTGSIKISCVGDSITYGLGVRKEREYAWASLLPEKLGEDYQTINYGLTKRTLLSTGDMPYNEEELAKEFWAGKEDIIIFMLGTNDSKKINWKKKEFKEEYETMVKRLKEKQSHPKVYIMLPPVVYENTGKEDRPRNDVLEKEIIPIIKEVGEKEKVTIIDLHSLTANHSEWFDDGLHPNKEGNEAIAKEIARVIKADTK